jgi:arabinofuranan 3-O-arabinosyltransferase
VSQSLPGRISALAVSFAAGLTPRRLRAQTLVLAICLWGVCAADFATPGLLDRGGNIKFQDFLPLYASARMIAEGRGGDLYNQEAVAATEWSILGRPASVRLPNLYGPQVALLFVPFTRFSFPTAGLIWMVISLILYAASIYLVLKTCAKLMPYRRLVAIAAIAFPPLFHMFVRGQTSSLALACFTAAFLAFRADRPWLAGIALGTLVLKPQFLVAVPLVFLLSRSWTALATLLGSAAAQMLLAWIYFGSAVLRAYFARLWQMSHWIGDVELSLAPIQMHSLRSFWSLLIPLAPAALALYGVTSIVVIVLSAAVWKSVRDLSRQFAALLLVAVLVNPHLFVYDLLVLAPALLLIVNWALAGAQDGLSPALYPLSYLAFMLPLVGPLSRWTHVQLTVPCFAALLWILWKQPALEALPPSGHELASLDSRVV